MSSTMTSKKLPLRIGVGIILLNQENKVFVGKRIDNQKGDRWQMPQGGIDENENYLQAARRELREETSIKTVKVIKELKEWLIYELPKNLLGKIWKGKYRGQKQKWFVVRFLGHDSEININTKYPEFIEWKWIDIEKLPSQIVLFKKHVYEEITANLLKLIN